MQQRESSHIAYPCIRSKETFLRVSCSIVLSTLFTVLCYVLYYQMLCLTSYDLPFFVRLSWVMLEKTWPFRYYGIARILLEFPCSFPTPSFSLYPTYSYIHLAQLASPILLPGVGFITFSVTVSYLIYF